MHSAGLLASFHEVSERLYCWSLKPLPSIYQHLFVLDLSDLFAVVKSLGPILSICVAPDMMLEKVIKN